MKKTMIALVVTAMTATSVQAAPMVDSFYTGLKTGWVSGHYDINQFNNIDRDDVTYGLFGGYQFAKNFAVELGYDYLGKIKTDTVDVRNHGASLSLKGNYPVSMINGLDVYGKVGAAFIRSDYDVHKEYLSNDHDWRVSPLFGAGFEYSPQSWKNLAFNLEYQWINKVGKFENNRGIEFKPSLGSVTAGISYRFGQDAAVEPVYIDKTFAMNSDIAFDFNSANLTKEAQAQLNNIYDYMKKVNTEAVTVAGHADRIGSDHENEQLSLHRAEHVASYLVDKGVAKDILAVEHYGSKNSITGMTCDGIKDHKKLIACLAPDRRVEIAVRGTK